MKKISWGSGKINGPLIITLFWVVVIAIIVSITTLLLKKSMDKEKFLPWTENVYYEGMIPEDPNHIPAFRDDPEIRKAIRKWQIRLIETGPGFYEGDLDGRYGRLSREAYDRYVMWYMTLPIKDELWH